MDVDEPTQLLSDEWKPVEDFARLKYDQMDSTHSWNHGVRTVKLAKYIAEHEGADLLVVSLGALLHQYHPEETHKVQKFLETNGINADLVERVIHCIECVEVDTISRAKTIEAKVVFDADKLQTLGSFGIIREVSYRIFTQQIDYREAVDQAIALQRQMSDLIQTRTAKRMAEELKDLGERVYSHFEDWESLSFL